MHRRPPLRRLPLHLPCLCQSNLVPQSDDNHGADVTVGAGLEAGIEAGVEIGAEAEIEAGAEIEVGVEIEAGVGC